MTPAATRHRTHPSACSLPSLNTSDRLCVALTIVDEDVHRPEALLRLGDQVLELHASTQPRSFPVPIQQRTSAAHSTATYVLALGDVRLDDDDDTRRSDGSLDRRLDVLKRLQAARAERDLGPCARQRARNRCSGKSHA